MNVLLRLIVAIFALVIVLTLAFLFATLQSQPKTVQIHQISAQGAKQSQQLLKRLIATAKKQGDSIITVSKPELDGLAALVHRAIPKAAANVEMSPQAFNLSLSYELPLPDVLKFLNLTVKILPSTRGLVIERVRVGHLSLSGPYFLSIARVLTDHFIKQGIVDDVLAMFKRLKVNEQQVDIALYLDGRLLDKTNDKSLLMRLRDDLALFGDVEEISYYYQEIVNFSEHQSPKGSIANYVKQVFKLAQQRSQLYGAESAIKQNQSAIMALVIYFGTDRFELMVGNVIEDNVDQLLVRNRVRANTTLRGRNDLQKHFIYSMALQMFSNLGASDAIGEYKEFLDSNSGGSGFSFVDLMADRAGTRLAQIVVANQYKAQQSQAMLADISDESLLPTIEGLGEGYTADEFSDKYRDINANAYKQALVAIDQRLVTLPLYQLGW